MHLKPKIFFISVLLLSLPLISYYTLSSFLTVTSVELIPDIVMREVRLTSPASVYVRRVELVVYGGLVTAVSSSVFNDRPRDINVSICAELYDMNGNTIGTGCTVATVPRKSLLILNIPISQNPPLLSTSRVDVYVGII